MKDGEVEDLEYIEVEIEDEPQAPDQLNLAKLFTEPNEYKDVSPRQYLEDLFSKPASHLFDD